MVTQHWSGRRCNRGSGSEGRAGGPAGVPGEALDGSLELRPCVSSCPRGQVGEAPCPDSAHLRPARAQDQCRGCRQGCSSGRARERWKHTTVEEGKGLTGTGALALGYLFRKLQGPRSLPASPCEAGICSQSKREVKSTS